MSLIRHRVAAQLVPDANNAKALRLAVEIRVEREKAGDEKAPAPAADNVRRLLKEYRDALALVKTEVERRYRQGLTNIAYVYKATVPLRNTELDLAETQEERLRILERVLIERSSFEDLTRTRYDAQLVSEVDYLNAKALRLEAEIRLEREKVGGE